MRQIFLLAKDSLTAMTEAPYERENILQELLAKFPSILSGDDSDTMSQHRWLLVDREVGVPDAPEGNNRWSLDHLFLDEEGVPTLVEVKRSSDTRIRREVVGQMLDYAANAVSYWPVPQLRARFETVCAKRKETPSSLIAEVVGNPNPDCEEEFWMRVKTNLQAGRIRMIFLADEIPPELKSIVEFLNEQMDPAEVLAVEVRQFVGSNGSKTLVPHLIGQTATSVGRKTSPRTSWNEESFLVSVRDDFKLPSTQIDAIQSVLKLATEEADDLGWGTGIKTGSFSPKFPALAARSLFTVRSNGTLTLNFGALEAPGSVQEIRRQFMSELSAIPAFKPYLGELHSWPSVDISTWAPVANDFVNLISRLIERNSTKD